MLLLLWFMVGIIVNLDGINNDVFVPSMVQSFIFFFDTFDFGRNTSVGLKPRTLWDGIVIAMIIMTL